MRSEDERYFQRIEAELDRATAVAREARARGGDPTPDIEIPTARDMADRVENILGIEGVAQRVRELEGEMSREEAALALVEDFVEDRVGNYETKGGKIEGAVRTAVALLTEGVVAAPIEGIDRVEVNENDDGTQYVAVYYAGPIRSAGGTAQALSVLVADYARALLDVDAFKPRDAEIARYAEEVGLYDSETGLQYSPKDKETEYIVKHCPIMLDGEATGDEEVSGYRDLDRIDTNSPRGGMCLVLAEGIALKAPKIQRYTRELEEVSWPWLQDLIDGTIGGTAESDEDSTSEDTEADADSPSADQTEGPPQIESSDKYLQDLIAGRPVFGHPGETGGFRLRYGRSRNLGHATAGIHPATMRLVDDFLAPGTQIKTELPGKAAGIVPVDSIEGPTVRLADGEVRRIDNEQEALRVRNGVERIVDLGEYLVNYGEFVENNHSLAPASYTVEWWRQDLAATGADLQALEDDIEIDLADPSPQQAISWAQEYDAPLHPQYTYLWHDITVDQFLDLADALAEAKQVDGALQIPVSEQHRDILEALLVEHHQGEEKITIPDWRPLVRSVGLTETLDRTWSDLPDRVYEWPNAMRAVETVAPFTIQERAPTRVGNRMGRPEKSERRELSPAVHTLFPIGEAGGNQRDFEAAAKHTESLQDTPGEVTVDVGQRRCDDCNVTTYRSRCPSCGDHIDPHYTCPDCDQTLEPDESGRVYCDRCEMEGDAIVSEQINLNELLRDALDTINERSGHFDILKGVKGLSSSVKTPEPIEKGILRAKHDVSVFKDGTIRYDMTDLPVTAVKPEELGVSVDQFRELGYHEDIHGEPLRHESQLVELKIQDIVLSEGAAEHMRRTADFVDDLLESYYGIDPYYEAEDPSDLIGELVFGMAPHTSAAVVGRVVGITDVAGGYAHPYFHAAKRRNCDGDEDCVMLLMDGLLNFSKAYLPDKRGGSVAADARIVAVDPDDTVRFLSIEDFWEQLATESIREGMFYKKPCKQEGWQTYVFDADHAASLRPIEKAIRYTADTELLRITTERGRSIDITASHSLFRYADGIEEVRGSDLTVGDYVIAPQQLPTDGTIQQIDVSSRLADPHVLIDHTANSLLPDLTADGGTVVSSQSPTIPIDRVAGIDSTHADSWTVTVPGESDGIPAVFDFDAPAAELFGHLAAFDRHGTTPESFECLSAQTRARISELMEVVFGDRGSWDLSFGVPTVVDELIRSLAIDPTAAVSIPEPLLESSPEVIAGYLRGLMFAQDRDGTVTVADPTIKDTIVFLCHSVGAVATVCSTEDSYQISIRAETPEQLAASGPAVPIPTALQELYSGANPEIQSVLPSDLSSRETLSVNVLEEIYVELSAWSESPPVQSAREAIAPLIEGDLSYLRITDIETQSYDGYLYDLQVGGEPIFVADWLYAHNSMDAPLVMSSRIDPAEIDDEAHNVDIMEEYPREFYQATRELAHPEDIDDKMTIAEETVGTDSQYTGFRHTQPTTNIAAGPDLSAYKTLDSMTDKMDAQLELARKLRAVDETDVAERVIEYHFLPDLLGNLRAFARQEVRCLDCETSYRRVPLTGDCRECGGNMTLTVHEGSVNKYLQTALDIAEEYGAREYTKQRLEVLDRSISRIFENDKSKQSGIADFM